LPLNKLYVSLRVPCSGLLLIPDTLILGMLSKEELGKYGTGTLTMVFIERVFQECLTYDGEMVSPQTLHTLRNIGYVNVTIISVSCSVLLLHK